MENLNSGLEDELMEGSNQLPLISTDMVHRSLRFLEVQGENSKNEDIYENEADFGKPCFDFQVYRDIIAWKHFKNSLKSHEP